MDKRSGFLLFAAAAVLASTGMSGCSKPPEVTPARAAAASAGGNVTDLDVTEHVKTALRQSASLKGFDIAVVTLKGDVRLTGVLDSQTQIDEAIRVARAADGAHTINDELTLRK